MTLGDFKIFFHGSLDPLYGRDEVDSFLNILCEDLLGFNRLEIALNKHMTLNASSKEALMAAHNKLKKHMPIQYIIGWTDFMGLKISVNDGVLIPRPETEELVTWIVNDHKSSESSTRILDIGTGSGCIAIALSKFLKNSTVIGCDISVEALDIAKRNALINSVDTSFIEYDILLQKNGSLISTFDIIVSNPPYIRELEKSEMKPNVLDYEPHGALFVKNDNPLLFYERIIDFATKHLRKNGELYFEINEYLSKELIVLLENRLYVQIELKKDMYGKHRMIKAQKR